jgi:hypothetical protein
VILEVLAVIDVPPETFFERPMPQRAPFRRRRGRRPLRRPSTDSLPEGVDASSPVVRGMLRLLAERGLLTPEDLAELQREMFPGEPPSPPRT